MTHSSIQTDLTPVYSDYAGDPDYQELVVMFLESLEDQRREFTEAHRDKCWEELARKAHQLKGAGGGYGFPGLTKKAQALEDACDDQVLDEIPHRLDDLFAYIDRLHS